MTMIQALAKVTLLLTATSVHSFIGPGQDVLRVPSAKSISVRPQATPSSCTQLFESTPGRINQKIELSSPKVATIDNPTPGEKVVYCRCWKSGTFPLCNGAHVAHNKETGDNVGPLIVTAEKKEEVAVVEEEKIEGVAPVEETVEDSKELAVADDEKTTLMNKVKKFLGFKQDNPDGLTARERLAKMGLSALLSYGWVSNMSYAVTLSLSWYGFSKKTGLSPLAPGQWKPFLAVYAGFYVFNNIIRPLRFGASVVVSKYFDNFVSFIQNKTKLSRKWSIGVVVIIANVFGTFAAMGLGVSLASAAAGVPIFPPKA